MDRPLMIVDDCVLSGLRAREMKQLHDRRRTVLATLVAPAALSQQALQPETGLECITAVELEDLAPSLYGSRHEEWREHWTQLADDSTIWIGQPEYVSFAWTEPDEAFFNVVTEEIEPGFRLTPAERCLRHRAATGPVDGGDAEGFPAAVQICVDGPGPVTAPSDVLSARLTNGQVAVARFDQQNGQESTSCYILDSTAGEMWGQLLKHGTVEGALEALADQYDVDPERLRHDVRDFERSLVHEGLLSRA
jgi:hypothetical protein